MATRVIAGARADTDKVVLLLSDGEQSDKTAAPGKTAAQTAIDAAQRVVGGLAVVALDDDDRGLARVAHAMSRNEERARELAEHCAASDFDPPLAMQHVFEEGDLLHIPAGWVHYVETAPPSDGAWWVSLNRFYTPSDKRAQTCTHSGPAIG